MRTISTRFREAMNNPDTAEILVVLLTIHHPDWADPIRVSSDPTQLISETPEEYATISRNLTFRYRPFSITLPDDVPDRSPRTQIVIENITRELIALVRGSPKRGVTMDIELVLAATPSFVEVAFYGFDLGQANYNASTITLDLSIDSMDTEPYPAGSFTPSYFPGLF